MRPLPALSIGIALGALASTAAWFSLGGRAACSAPGEPGPADADAADPTSRARPERGPAADGERLAGIEAQLAALTAEIAVLRERLAEAGARRPLASGTGVDERALAEALRHADDERARRRLASLSDEQLLAEARRRGEEDPVAERELLESLLERPLSTRHRTQALAYLGVLHRKGGALLESEHALHEAAVVGAHTDDGAWATYELATTVAESGDPDRALEIVLPVASTPGISDWNRLHAEWVTASLQAETGDLAAARKRYERIVGECEGTEFDWLAKKAAHRLQATR